MTADWKAGDGSTGHGHGVNLTGNSGYFWFFDAANIEIVVKVLDGCPSNQRHWAFAAGLTNVELTTTVTDTFSGLSQTYTNTRGTPFAPIQDTAAPPPAHDKNRCKENLVTTRSRASAGSLVSHRPLYSVCSGAPSPGRSPYIAFHVDSPAGIAPGPDGAM